MNKTGKSVLNGERLSYEQKGILWDRIDDLKRRANNAPDKFSWMMAELQKLAESIGGKSGNNNPATSYIIAKKIFGKNCLSVDALAATYGIWILGKDIPPVPRSVKELRRYSGNPDLQLVLLADTAKDGTPQNFLKINETTYGKFSDGSKLLYSGINSDWVKGSLRSCGEQPFEIEHPPALYWALMGKSNLPRTTTNSIFTDKMEIQITFLQENLYQGNQLPLYLEEAVKEFHLKKSAINMEPDQKKNADAIQGLQITFLMRESCKESLDRIVMTEKMTGEKLFPRTRSMTRSRDSVGKFVSAGDSADGAVHICSDWPDDDCRSRLGFAFFLRLK